MLVCLQIGLSLDDFKSLKVGTIFDLITAKHNMLEEQNAPRKKDTYRKPKENEHLLGFMK